MSGNTDNPQKEPEYPKHIAVIFGCASDGAPPKEVSHSNFNEETSGREPNISARRTVRRAIENSLQQLKSSFSSKLSEYDQVFFISINNPFQFFKELKLILSEFREVNDIEMSDIFLYGIAHGISLNNGFYFITDETTDPSNPQEVLDVRSIIPIVNEFRFRNKILFIDSCASGNIIRNISAYLFNTVSSDLSQKWFILSSVSSDNKAYLSRSGKMSQFTFDFLDILDNGIADSKIFVSLNDVYQETSRRAKARDLSRPKRISSLEEDEVFIYKNKNIWHDGEDPAELIRTFYARQAQILGALSQLTKNEMLVTGELKDLSAGQRNLLAEQKRLDESIIRIILSAQDTDRTVADLKSRLDSFVQAIDDAAKTIIGFNLFNQKTEERMSNSDEKFLSLKGEHIRITNGQNEILKKQELQMDHIRSLKFQILIISAFVIVLIFITSYLSAQILADVGRRLWSLF